MKTLRTIDVQKQICKIIGQNLQYASKMIAEGKQMPKFYTEIENVGFFDMFSLWTKLRTDNKRLFMPGELENDRITIVYKVSADFVIQIESEPCFNLYGRNIEFKPYHFN